MAKKLESQSQDIINKLSIPNNSIEIDQNSSYDVLSKNVQKGGNNKNLPQISGQINIVNKN